MKIKKLIPDNFKKTVKRNKFLLKLIKSYRYKKQIQKFKIENTYIPTQYRIELTNHCNAECIMCPHTKMKRKKGVMSWDTLKKLIKDIKAINNKPSFLLHGTGESFIDKNCLEKISYVYDQIKTPITIYSNGSLIHNIIATQTTPLRLTLIEIK